MAVKIRLARRGSKKRPFYDIVAIDSRKKRDGKPLEKLGYFNPMVEKETEQRKKLVIVHDSVEKWLKNGAIPSETVAKKLASVGFQGLENFIEPVKTSSVGVSKKEIAKKKAEQAEIAKQKAKEKAEAKKKAAQQASAGNA
jgi:small subunit ribosomal protein S16